MMRRRITGSKKRKTLLKALFFFYLGVCLFGIVWLRTAVVGLEYEIGALDKLRAEQISERKLFTVQRAGFFSTGHVEEVALKRLGMSRADRENIFFVRRSPVAGLYKASMK
jgi:hypothetical protein